MENFENIRLPWPDWKIVRYLGGGAYGKVYEIERTISGMQEKEKAALKIVSRPKDEDEIEEYEVSGYDKESIIESYKSEIQNYVQEYKLMRTLQGQTNIVSCDDFTVVWNENGIGGNVFIRMELLTPLNRVLKERELSTEEIIKLGKDIASALILCEKKNIIHRDIKPANIMVSQFGNYKLGDFGVSKIMDHATYATAMGTPEYQAPEVVHMGKYGQTADIYSLGITLYWLLNNRRMPFIGANEQLTVERKDEAMEKRYRGEKLPAPKNGSAKLKKIVLKACEYNPEDRYASAQEMYDDLDTLRSGEATGETAKKVKSEDVSFDDGKTGGNSWRDDPVTIEKAPGRTPKKDTSNFQDEPEEKTEGVKDAYQRQKEKEKKKERTTVVADVPVQAKKKSGGWKNILVILIVIGIAVGGYHLISGTESGKSTKKASTNTNSTSEKSTEFEKSTNYYDNGNISSVLEHDTNGTIRKATYYREDGTIKNSLENNESGATTKYESYDESGKLESYNTKEYDENGNSIKQTFYDKNDKITQTNTMEYDENGNRIKITFYDGTGKIKSYRISEYDSDNNQVKDTEYDEAGNVLEYSIYEKAEDGKLPDYTTYDAQGNVKEYGKYEDIKTESGATGQQLRVYDANGKLIER